ncbi:MAG: alpha-amylase family glycosyl hydrolase [Bacteroidales bacterium]|nr:alpha-amylase family glycosyl hydrolase [Bacteroidales bacterium]
MLRNILIKVFFLFFFSIFQVLQAQVITFTPAYPKVTDTITITFNAALGNGALSGISPVYLHTGVVTDRSVSLSDWKFRPSIWGTPDTNVLMQSLGNNLHVITFRIDSFYDLPSNVIALNLGFVFRNADGSVVGRNSDGSDIFIPLFNSGFDARFTAPLGIPLITTQGTVIPIEITSTQQATINLFHNGISLNQINGQILNEQITAPSQGKYWLKFIAQTLSDTISDSTYYIVQPALTIQDPPSGLKNGINYINDSTVVLILTAPFKSFVYVTGDFTNWELDPDYLMNKSVSGEQYWLEITHLIPQQEYRFQYSVDAQINIGDPFSEKILDEFNDPGINAIIYPNLIPYPVGKTSEIVSVMQPGRQPYQWANQTYQISQKEDLIIYELLVRDFSMRHDFKAIIDKLDYLKELGINAIELMPVMEFDGNDSWGYAPAFYTAVDKYYGPADSLKVLVDSAHGKGMAIILDIVPNHAFGQFPYVRLYWDGENKKPAPNSPYFNFNPTHPFSVGYDFNHDAYHTQQYFDQVFKYWVDEYKIDGYRIDLSKGITQNNTGGDVGAWSQYDIGRINLLKRLANQLWNTHPGKWIILEHFANNDEETELANFGFMLWSIAHSPYKEAALGWPLANSNFEWNVSYQEKGWSQPHAVGFYESHDEERMMYEMLNYGNSAGTYNVRHLKTAINRKALLAAFLFTVPGPKMTWQFGELGFDYSIFWPTGTEISRTVKKPVRWDYFDDVDRHCMFCKYSAIVRLRTENPEVFRSSNFNIDASGLGKRIWVSHNDMNVLVLGNFSVSQISMVPDFQHTGTWYDYLAGTSYPVSNTQNPITLQPGEFRIFTNVQLPDPHIEDCCNAGSNIFEPDASLDVNVYPNPFTEIIQLSVNLDESSEIDVEIQDMYGRKVASIYKGRSSVGIQHFYWNGKNSNGQTVSSGYYFYKIKSNSRVKSGKIIFITN